MTNEIKPIAIEPDGSTADPFQAPAADLLSATDSLQYVGFWARVFAAVIDTIVTTLVMLPPMFLLFGPSVLGTGLDHKPGVLYTILSLLGPAVFVFIFWIKKAATPGKMLIKSKIIDATHGGKPTIKQWVIRYVGYLVSIIPLGLGLLAVGWDGRKQGWHDKMANTLVVKK